MSSPRVSVLLPARDAGATVAAAVESLLAQTLRSLEVLAVDDGSRDDTRARLEALAARDGRVRVLDGGGRGLVAALTLALGQARAPLIARMDADDLCLPDRLARQLEALEAHPTWAGVGTGVEVFREDRPPSPNLQAYARWLSSLTTPEALFRDRFVESPLCHPSVLLRREALEAAGGWREGPFPEDYELWLRLLEAGHPLSCVPEVLVRWRDHPRRLTRTDHRYALARHLDLKAGYLARRLRGQRLVLVGATEVGRGLSRRLQAEGLTVAGFVELAPRKLGQRIHGAPVVPPAALDTLGPAHLLCAVGVPGAREELRAWLKGLGRREGEDFTAVA